ncbi:MAG: hypothetical protein DRH37_00905 [Deltaproteobacteria bacterium]|nr:MAG: hypothetical protein DRH37_00905 [Deltaproteobacteria bacterium]
MDTRKAIMAFSQSEKIKSGIIWLSSLLELMRSLSPSEKQGGEKIVRTCADMVFQEIRLVRSIADDNRWEEAERCLDQAVVMMDSGVSAESIIHLTQALSQVTSIGQQTMSFLQDQGLL